MLTCDAKGCLSNENTKIHGRTVLFFPFPEDNFRKEQWIRNCSINDADAKNKVLHVCELHFEKASFTVSSELKPGVVPVIFDKMEEQRKRRAQDGIDTELSKTIPTKQKKLDALVSLPHRPLRESMDNTKEDAPEIKTKISEQDDNIKEIKRLVSPLYNEFEVGKKVYRLTIQIDKMCHQKYSKSQKIDILADLSKEAEDCCVIPDTSNQENQSSPKIEKKPACEKGSCVLRKTTYDSRLAYQCDRCDKYYIIQESNVQGEKENACSLCHKTFPTPQSLYLHIKSHFICDMCQTECTSQVSYDKHARLHVSTDPKFPYKCHQCTDIFELKEDVRQHYLFVHPTIKLQNTILHVSGPPLAPRVQEPKEYRCIGCNITFRNCQAYKNHVSSHKKKEDLRCNINDSSNIFPVPNPLTGSQIGILRAVKFSCRVCSMEFDNVGEVDKHTRTHLEDAEEEHQCNICRKLFKSNTEFNEHLKYHLSRAHPCPICSKTFINRTTLKIHMKTHGES